MIKSRIFIFIFLLISLYGFSQREIKFAVELQKFSMYDPMWTITDEELNKFSKEIAAKIVKGSIFGYNFYIEPAHKDRNLKRLFFLELIDKPIYYNNLTVYSLDNTQFFYNSFYRYKLSGTEELLLERIVQKNNKIIFAKSEELVAKDTFPYDNLIKKAVEDALIDYLKDSSKNKPKRVDGRVYFFNAPVIKYNAGTLTCQIRLYLEINNILDWNAF